MVYKVSKFGKFLACPGYPECRNTMAIRTETGTKCPRCGGEILEKKSHKGNTFYGCENYPKCDFMAWDKPVKKEACPECGGLLLKRKGRNAKIYCSNEACKYERKPERKEKK
jgi:DNA topoisomerase-1